MRLIKGLRNKPLYKRWLDMSDYPIDLLKHTILTDIEELDYTLEEVSPLYLSRRCSLLGR